MTPSPHDGGMEEARAALESQGRRPLMAFLQAQRWFGGKGRPLIDVRVVDTVALPDQDRRRGIALLAMDYRGQEPEHYAMPFLVRQAADASDAHAIVAYPESSRNEWVCDATPDPDTWRALYEAIAGGKELLGQVGCLVGRTFSQGRAALLQSVQEVRQLSAEQSNTSIVFDRRTIVKWIRKVEQGVNPDSEMLEFLTTHTSYAHVPPLWGVMTYESGQEDAQGPATVAVAQQFVPNHGDGWSYTLAHLEQLVPDPELASPSAETRQAQLTQRCADYHEQIRRLGAMTAQLHLALSSDNEADAFRPEPITKQDAQRWRAAFQKQADDVSQEIADMDETLRADAGLTADEVSNWRKAARRGFAAVETLPTAGAVKIRHHGDYHLGQVLKTDESFVIIDFEGEPARALADRRAKVCPLKDVAGMLRSFSYAAHSSQPIKPGGAEAAPLWIEEWEQATRTAFLDGYRSEAQPGHAPFLPPTWEETAEIIRAYEIDKVWYELRYELRNRPQWLSIPVAGLRTLLATTP